jgi:hypothetical protein
MLHSLLSLLSEPQKPIVCPPAAAAAAAAATAAALSAEDRDEVAKGNRPSAGPRCGAPEHPLHLHLAILIPRPVSPSYYLQQRCFAGTLTH